VDITETGILKFVFEEIIVPQQDTTYGFLKFRIGQKETNQAGILIENKVSFYRAYEVPEIFYYYQHNTGKRQVKESLLHYHCEGVAFEELPLKDTITTFSIDIINANETILLSNITIEIDSFITTNEEQVIIDTLVAHNGCDSIVIYRLLLTDIESPESIEQGIRVYPNPAQHQFSISCLNKLDKLNEIQLYNAHAQLIMVPSLNKNQKDIQLDLQALPNGLYSLIVTTKQGVFYKKLLVFR